MKALWVFSRELKLGWKGFPMEDDECSDMQVEGLETRLIGLVILMRQTLGDCQLGTSGLGVVTELVWLCLGY